MDMEITYTAQYGLEWRIILPDPSTPSASHDSTPPDKTTSGTPAPTICIEQTPAA